MHSKIFSFSVFILGLSILSSPPLSAQGPQDLNPMDSVHEIPFGSTENVLELEVSNTTDQTLEQLVLQIDHPVWVLLRDEPAGIPILKPGETFTIKIIFDITDKAPVKDTKNLLIKVSDKEQLSWNKRIALHVNPPDQFQLLQNYPNPFNPSTNIKYMLPEPMHVTVSVYDLTGRRVARLLDSQQEPGSHNVQWNASTFASGIYFYRIVAKNPNGDKIIQNKKMLLIK